MSTTRTITLSDRPPATVVEENWPVIASATRSEHDGQVEQQANRRRKWSMHVRQHEDGRTIIYATYTYVTNWQKERGYSVKHGQLIAADKATTEEVCRTIKHVAERMMECEHASDDADRWRQIADECIADLPADSLD